MTNRFKTFLVLLAVLFVFMIIALAFTDVFTRIQ